MRCGARKDQLDGPFEKLCIAQGQGKRNILQTTKGRKADRVGHILCRNCWLTRVIEGKTEGTGRRGRGRKQLLDDLKETRRWWTLKEKALASTLWRTRFGRVYGLS
jgi:hypothetical protein